MFEQYKGMIDIDKVLYDSYQYQYHGDIEDFYSQSFIEFEGNGKDALCWITYQSEKYLFKKISNFSYNIWGELLSSELAKMLGIPCAEYRVASLHGERGILSKSFLKDDDRLILGREFFQKFYDKSALSIEDEHSYKKMYDGLSQSMFQSGNRSKYIFHSWNNLKDVDMILKENPDITEKEYFDLFYFHIYMFLFDLITLQGDRHPDNWGHISRDGKILPGYLYDNSASFGLGFPNIEDRVIQYRNEFMTARMLRNKSNLYSLMYQSKPLFVYSRNDIIHLDNYITEDFPHVFSSFLESASNEIILIVDDFLECAKSINFEELVKNLEDMNGVKMDEDVYFYVNNIFHDNLLRIEQILYDFKKGSRKK